MPKSQEQAPPSDATQSACFVIMPIADPDGYDDGHFRKVYEDIFKPACNMHGFKAIRADDVKQTNLIHLDILQKLIESPMAICDLSSSNPNVLFELGLRQAFDKPTVLVQESDTPKIFDIAPLRYTEYRKGLRYREVLEDQIAIGKAIEETQKSTQKGEGVNSIVKILSLAKPATLEEVTDGDSSGLLQLVRAEMSEMRSDFRKAMLMFTPVNDREFSDDNCNIPINFKRRIMESHEALREVEMLMEKKVPIELVDSIITSIQRKLSRLLKSNTPKEYRDEARNMYLMTEKIREVAHSRKAEQ